MLKTSITIPAAELRVVEANLDQCPGVRVVGVDHFSRDYCDVYLDYINPDDVEHLGSCVDRELRGEVANAA